jgi:hypothetical protein
MKNIKSQEKLNRGANNFSTAEAYASYGKELEEVIQAGTEICLARVINMLKNEKLLCEKEGSSPSPLREEFDQYFEINSVTLDEWTSDLSKRAYRQDLFIELLGLVELAHRWEAIKISLGYEYGEEFTLTLLAIRDKLYRMKRISHGESVSREPRVTIHETLFAIYDSSGNIDERLMD